MPNGKPIITDSSGNQLRECTKCKLLKPYPKGFWKHDRSLSDRKTVRNPKCADCCALEKRTNPKQIYQTCKVQAKLRGFDPYLSFDDWFQLRQETNCCCCSVSFAREKTNTNEPTQLTIDRVDNGKGYSKENCRAVCRKCNDLKTANTKATLQTILFYLERELG